MGTVWLITIYRGENSSMDSTVQSALYTYCGKANIRQMVFFDGLMDILSVEKV